MTPTYGLADIGARCLDDKHIEKIRSLGRIIVGATNALNLTYTNVPQDGSRAHWCSYNIGHDATCGGMLRTQDELRKTRDMLEKQGFITSNASE